MVRGYLQTCLVLLYVLMLRLVLRTTNQQWSISFGGQTWVNIRTHSRRHSVPKTRNLSNVRRLGAAVKRPRSPFSLLSSGRALMTLDLTTRSFHHSDNGHQSLFHCPVSGLSVLSS